MIGIDANVLIRDAVQDDPVQSPIARRFLRSLSEDAPGFLSIVALVETTWTLARAYKFESAQIALFVSRLLASQEIVVQASGVVRRALNDASGADFADALIAHLALDADCDYTVTFDRRAAELPGMRLLE
ncbi:PIN domain-containing protein [Conyzicola sp.]|uniref:PIN domain-containing protein n=1 Tax=Conyzicola sp. TaxID=1969404 RepID=UPI0039894662